DYTKTRIANMGAKTVTYADAKRHFQTTYNWSQNQQIDEFTRLVASISATLEFGRKLDADYRHAKLALDEDLKQMEDVDKSSGLAEMQLVQPTLQRIAQDKSVLHIARTRAERMLDKLPQAGEAPAATGAKPRP